MLLLPVLNYLAVNVAYFGCKSHHGRLGVQRIHWSVQESETFALQVQINRSSSSTARANLPSPRSDALQQSALLLRALVCLKSIKSLLGSAAFCPHKMESGNVYKKIKLRVTLWELILYMRKVWFLCLKPQSELFLYVGWKTFFRTHNNPERSACRIVFNNAYCL